MKKRQNKYDKTGARACLFDRSIEVIRKAMFPDGNEWFLPEGFSYCTADKLKVVSGHLIEIFAGFWNSGDFKKNKKLPDILC